MPNRTFEFTIMATIIFGIAVQNTYGQFLTYQYTGKFTEITTNENDVIPDLKTGDDFSGYVTFDSNDWHQTVGTVFVTVNGIDLLFSGSFIYGAVEVIPTSSYWIRIAGDTGGDIGTSTFSAGNFGPYLEDTDGSAGHSVPFPSSLNLSEFETNRFTIWGTYISTGDSINAIGQLTEFILVPEPSTGWSVLILCSLFVCRRESRC